MYTLKHRWELNALKQRGELNTLKHRRELDTLKHRRESDTFKHRRVIENRKVQMEIVHLQDQKVIEFRKTLYENGYHKTPKCY